MVQCFCAETVHITDSIFEFPIIRSSKHTRNAILEVYRRLCYTGQGSDPYKIALFKVLGRCELYKKNLPEVTPSIEDYLWLQVSLLSRVIITNAPKDELIIILPSTAFARTGNLHCQRLQHRHVHS